MEKKVRMIDNDAYFPVLIELIEQGRSVPVLISGSSMSPFLIHCRDTVIVSKPDRPFKKGDMVFYQRTNGRYVMHRIHHINSKGELFLIGDAQTEIEGPIQPQQVFGAIHKVIRKGKTLEPGNFWWWFFEKVWIRMFPLRPFISRLYAKKVR